MNEKVHLINEKLINILTYAMNGAKSIYILTSFVMKSGVELIAPFLKEAVSNGAEVKVCAGDYLFITDPKALKLLISLDEKIEVRLWRSNGRAFHPKAYLFQYEKNDGKLIVGSSNLSRSALTTGVEWNLLMSSEVSANVFEQSIEEFLKIFYHEHSISLNQETVLKYEQEYHEFHRNHPNLARTWTKLEKIELMFSYTKKDQEMPLVLEEKQEYETIIPREAQKEALEALENVIEEGYDKAMVVMATGLGKTYLAAFFAEKFQKVLFIAHRMEILRQAKRSFQRVLRHRTHGLFAGGIKEKKADCLFASNLTLFMEQNLLQFSPNEFDLIIVDEFHHAAAKTYERILEYFRPQFLLGITATPYRMDGKDVFAICEGNVAYQIHFIEAIQRQWLCPFHYYGVYDEIDYAKIQWLGNRYDEEQLLLAQLKEDIAEKIFHAWQKHKQTRTLAFCSSIKQAEFLANFFQEKGIRAASAHSQGGEFTREEVIKRLEEKKLDIVFTVDLFNEGVDIPSLDTLLFVRPTESLTIFTQQIGRGLRLHDEKEYCVIIDLIGNYRNADIKLQLFDTRTENERQSQKSIVPVVPENCFIHFDTKVINLLEELNKKKQPRKEQLRHAYFSLKEELGRRPSYLEFHLYGGIDSKAIRGEFGSFAGFLYWAGELSEIEEQAFKRYEHWLKEAERTSMTKSYKMIVLSYMLSRGSQKWHEPVTPIEAAPYFYHYLMEKEYRKRIDFSDKTTKKLWDYNENETARLIRTMPMTKWSQSSKGLISFQNDLFQLEFTILPEYNEIVYALTKEICEYRLHTYFERKERKRHDGMA